MATIRPSGVVSATGWDVVGAANAAAAVNETSPNQAEYVHTIVNGASPLTYSLDGTAPPGQHELALGLSTLDGDSLVRVSLLDSGGTTQGTSTWQVVNNTPTTYTFSVVTPADTVRASVESVLSAGFPLLMWS